MAACFSTKQGSGAIPDMAGLSDEDVRRAKEVIEVLSSLTGGTSSISAAAAIQSTRPNPRLPASSYSRFDRRGNTVCRC